VRGRSLAIIRLSTAWPCLTVLELGAEDGGEIADLLGDQEIVLHEALDLAQTGMLGVAERTAISRWMSNDSAPPRGGEEVHVAAHRPEKIAAAPEPAVFTRVVDAVVDELLAPPARDRHIWRSSRGVQIAQAPIAVLDVGSTR